MSSSATTTRLAALGTYVFIGTRSAAELPWAESIAREIISDVDETCSRFRDDSDLSRVNNNPGVWVEVDPLLSAAVTSACAAARQTDGLVNPLLGRPLVLMGYDRDFGLLADGDEDAGAIQGDPLVPDIRSWEQIGIDPDGAVQIPVGTSLDLGSTGKAWAADLVATVCAEMLSEAALIDLGGDIRISRTDGEPWQIAISERPDDDPQAVVGLDGGGLATSSTQRRHWRRNGRRCHHLIDPRTGRSAAEVWTTVTATGPSCTAANVASTAAIVLGEEAPHWLAERGVSARLVSRTGQVTHVGDWPGPGEGS